MKKLVKMLAITAVMFLAISVSAKSESWTGWISDSGCGAKGASAEHKACALKCVKGGAKYVFVNSATKDVLPIHNQDAVKEDNVGMEVKVTGSLTDDKSIHVESIEPAGGK
ncbi:MAG TPA: hypothetical protein VG204_19475 [Terriglobia bacterium]|nr:hypothetical protein [Terriglobia bacterium]